MGNRKRGAGNGEREIEKLQQSRELEKKILVGHPVRFLTYRRPSSLLFLPVSTGLKYGVYNPHQNYLSGPAANKPNIYKHWWEAEL